MKRRGQVRTDCPPDPSNGLVCPNTIPDTFLLARCSAFPGSRALQITVGFLKSHPFRRPSPEADKNKTHQPAGGPFGGGVLGARSTAQRPLKNGTQESFNDLVPAQTEHLVRSSIGQPDRRFQKPCGRPSRQVGPATGGTQGGHPLHDDGLQSVPQSGRAQHRAAIGTTPSGMVASA